MKKYRFFAAALSLALTLGLTAPVYGAQSPSPEPSPEPTTFFTVGEGNAESRLLAEMRIDGTAAILMNAQTGDILYEQEAHEKRYPASITKVMSALLCIEAIDAGQLSLDDVIVVGPEVSLQVGEGSSTQNIRKGEEMRLEDVLYCALTASANEACNVLGQAVCGSVADFVALMNDRAKELGMEDTHFANTHGYHQEDHYTTAYDLAILCREAMTHPLFRQIVSAKEHTVPATNLHAARELHETNALISNFRYRGYVYNYATGIKTGSTPEAGLCLASSATKDGTDLIAVVLGCTRVEGTTGSEGMTQFMESRRLLEWGFDSFDEATILDASSFYHEVPVELSSSVNYVGVEPKGTISAILPVDMEPELFQRDVQFTQLSYEAPIQKGDVLGTITVSNAGKTYGTLDLVAVADIERSEFLYTLRQIQLFFENIWVRIGLIVLGVLILVLILKRLLFGKKRSRYGGARTYSGGSYTGKKRR